MRGNARVLSAGVVAAGVAAALALSSAPAAGTARAPRAPRAARAARAVPVGATAVTRVPVIVFLKDQPEGPGASHLRSGQRFALIQAAQTPYLQQARQLGATNVKSYRLVDAFAASVPATAVRQLAASPGVADVIPDSPITGPDPAELPAPAAASAGSSGHAAPDPTLPGACSAKPQLDPEGLALTHTDSATAGTPTARSLGYTGAGVKVAFLADGLDPGNVNLLRGGKPVITDYRDFSGDGTAAPTAGGEAFLDANAIAGQGAHVYDVSGFSAQRPAGPCDIRIEGTAPGVSLVALKVFSDRNVSSTSGFLQAIDYAVTVDHVNVINESFGSNPFPDVTSLDAVKRFNDMAVADGVTVVVASGDAGPFNTIGSPATDPAVLSVGASTDFRLYAQTDYAAADMFASSGWLNDNISALSSGGYTQDGRTVDMVAPGDLSFASCTANLALYSDCASFLGTPSAVEESGGTSQSAPLVAGAAALVIQAYRKAHGGVTPAPALVRQILLSTATDLGAPATEQGAGLLNSLAAVQEAASDPRAAPSAAGASGHRAAGGTAGAPVGETLRLSPNQLNYTGTPGSTAHWTVTVTNTGAKKQTVRLSGRTSGAASVVKTAAVTLSDTASPHFVNWAGVPNNYEVTRFTVPAGEARLDTSIAWPASAAAAGNLNARVRLILVDPLGRFAAHSLPQGDGGYGTAQVLHPAAGTWTAVIFGDTAAEGGTNGPVQFGASVSRYAGFGRVSPSALTLAPGQSGRVSVSAVVPAGAGDSSGALVLDGGGGAVSVPVTLRGMVAATAPGGGSLRGVLTGGDGRAPGEGQVAAYQFTVPARWPDALRSVTADVVLANDPANQVSGYLVAPDGQTTGYASNYLTTGFTSSGVPIETPERQLSVYTADPVPGTWTLLIDFTSPVPGNELADPFTGRVRFNITRAGRGGLPASPSVVLPRGRAATYPVTITNTGTAPEDLFLDPRLPETATYPLAPQDAVTGVPLPLPAAASPPEWIVPSLTHRVSATATSAVPIMFDTAPFPGDPDTASSSGLSATATFPAGAVLTTPVTPGLWYAVPSELGPYPPGGAPAATASLSMTAVAQAFDPAVSSPPGDFWEVGVRPLAASASYRLFTVNPGQTRTIGVTIKPSGPAGTVVRGTLYVDDFTDSTQFLSGSQLMALPYSYRIGRS
jgi:hypothetical protein